MSDVVFAPWVGADYKNGGIFNKRILALGESHYFAGEDSPVITLDHVTDFTSDVVRNYLDPDFEFAGWMNTFKKFERALVNKVTTPEDSRKIWNSIAFYNYIQAALASPRQNVPPELYEKSERAFFEVLEKLRPELILVWGVTRMWDLMPSNNSELCKNLKVDGLEIGNGYYILKDGTKIKTIWIYHPSAAFSWEYWHRVIKEGLR